MKASFARGVFLNCPFDSNYQPIFQALLFVIFDLGFSPRCALEIDDSSENRLDKIIRIIGECRYGIHDVSAVELGGSSKLPRFNMPLELGLFLGCKRYGAKQQRRKICLVLDSHKYRYQASISDIAGQDIRDHQANPDQAIIQVRDWLATDSQRRHLPGGAEVVARYERFRADLPALYKELKLKPEQMTFKDRCNVILQWLAADR